MGNKAPSSKHDYTYNDHGSWNNAPSPKHDNMGNHHGPWNNAPSPKHDNTGNHHGPWNNAPSPSPKSSHHHTPSPNQMDGKKYCGAGTEWDGTTCIVTYNSFLQGCHNDGEFGWKCDIQHEVKCDEE